jgi:hypothetical protein
MLATLRFERIGGDAWTTANVFSGGKVIAVVFANLDGTYCIYEVVGDYERWQHVDLITAECALIEMTKHSTT